MIRLLAVLLLAGFTPCLADPVSRSAPALYAEKIKPLLTKADSLLRLAPHKEAEARGGEVLLREEIVMVDEKAASVRVSHTIFRAVAESGVDAISRDVARYHRKRSRVSLMEARTIQPDGRSLPVRDDAAFLQTPQRSADSDIYNDQAEMVVVYPDVKKGSAAENITVREDLESRIPGEFTSWRPFDAGWPVRLDRYVLEMPRALAERTLLTNLGGGVPEAKREELDGGARVRWTWEKKEIPGGTEESGAVGADQTGPAVYITTLPDWEAFLKWYLPLAETSMVLSDALKSRVDEWTRDAKSPAEITAILLRKTASDVRYVGLEFGSGDLAPRSADATWDNQYGDCKDKSCLLAAMLRHKGIKACPALINTSFPGRVERRSPDFRHFDHCITAVEGPDGKWIFCDPTVPGLAPGGIGPADGDRDTLLIKEGVEWVRTPPHDFGTARHRIDVKMDAAGEVSGWVTTEAEGYNAAMFAERERQATPESLRDSQQSAFQRMAEGATAVDVKRHPREEGAPYRLETYILIPGSGAVSAPFLADSGYVPRTGNETRRETPFPAWRELYEAEARITLPSGLVPAELPDPLKSESPFADAAGGWEWKDGALISKFVFHAKLDTIPPADFPAFATQMRAVNAWISRPLALKKSADAPAAPAGDGIAALPRLPGVEGQLRLVESKYPDGANAPLRRAALEKAISYFPGDREMLHRAGTKLAWLDLTTGDAAAALRRLDGFQDSCRSHVDAEEAALGDYLRGLALTRLDREEEALTIFKAMSADTDLGGFRRTWCFYQTGLLQEKQDKPTEAAAAFQEGMALEESETEAVLYPPWARLLLKAKRGAEITSRLEKLVEDRPEAAPGILTHMAQSPEAAPGDINAAYLKVLADLGPPASFGQEFAAALAEASTGAELQAAQAVIRKRLADFVEKNPDSSRETALPEDVKSPEEAVEKLDGMMSTATEKDAELLVRLGLEAVLKSNPGADTSKAFWNLAQSADFRDRTAGDPEKTGPLLDKLLELGLLLPRPSDYRHETRALLIKVQRRRGQYEKARAEAWVMVSEADADRSWIELSGLDSLLEIAGEEGDRNETLRLCAELRSKPGYAHAEDAVFREAVVHILDGKYDEALKVLDELAARPEKELAKMKLHEQAASLLEWVKADRAAAVKWWKGSASWWPTVQAAAEKVSPGAKSKSFPLIPNQAEAAAAATQSAAQKEFAPVAQFLLRLGGAARLDPAYMSGYFATSSLSGTNGLAFATAELDTSVTKVEEFIPRTPAHRNLLMLAAESRYRRKEWEKSAAMAADYFAVKEKPDAASGFAARYWAAAADEMKRGYAEPAAALRMILDAKADEGERPRNLWMLANMLILDGKRAEAAALLRGELDGGKLNASHPMMANLRLLSEQTRGAAPMDEEQRAAALAAVDNWMAKAKPAWFDWIFPTSLKEPELKKDLSSWLAANQRARPAPALKTAVLILRDPAQPADTQRNALEAFLSCAAELSVDPAMRTEEWKTLFHATGLPEEERAAALAAALSIGASQEWRSTFAAWRNDPLLAKAPEQWTRILKRRGDLLDVPPADTAGLKAAALAILKDQPDSNALRDFYLAVRLLADRDPDAAGTVLEAFRETEFSGEAESLAESLKLDLPVVVETARELDPVHAALSAVALERLAPKARPLTDADLLTEEQSGLVINAPNEIRASLILRGIKDRSHDRTSLDVWQSLLFSQERSASQDLRTAMARAALEAATTDEAAVAAISLSALCLDRDDPQQAALADELFRPLMAKTEWTTTADALSFMENYAALRTGAATDVTSAIASIDDTGRKRRLTVHQIVVFLLADQKAKLRKLVRATPSATLLHPECLPASIAAWRALGMKEEVKVGEARLKTAARTLAENAWPTRDPLRLMTLILTATEAGDASLLPPGLEEDLKRWMKDPRDLAGFLVYLAFLKGDWETCARLGEEEIRDRPGLYPMYFLTGKALAKLGQKEKAAALLTTYLEKTHNELPVREAREILKSVRP